MQEPAVSHDHIRATTVKGTDVYNGEGEHLGHIDDIVLGKETGHAEYAIMSFGGFLGMGEKYHPLPWQSLHYEPERGGYVVNVRETSSRRRRATWPKTSRTGTIPTTAAASRATTAIR